MSILIFIYTGSLHEFENFKLININVTFIVVFVGWVYGILAKTCFLTLCRMGAWMGMGAWKRSGPP